MTSSVPVGFQIKARDHLSREENLVFISHAMKHELNFVFMSFTSLIVAKFTAHPQINFEEPNQNVEQERCKFAF